MYNKLWCLNICHRFLDHCDASTNKVDVKLVLYSIGWCNDLSPLLRQSIPFCAKPLPEPMCSSVVIVDYLLGSEKPALWNYIPQWDSYLFVNMFQGGVLEQSCSETHPQSADVAMNCVAVGVKENKPNEKEALIKWIDSSFEFSKWIDHHVH